jgi:hypothetical protein
MQYEGEADVIKSGKLGNKHLGRIKGGDILSNRMNAAFPEEPQEVKVFN